MVSSPATTEPFECHLLTYGPHLDLLKADTPFNKAKVSLKLHELEYKLDVEKKVMAGIKNMAWAFEKDPASTDRRRRAEVQGELYESNEKLNLLNKAVRKYKNLYIGESDEDDGKYFLLFTPFATNSLIT